MPYLLLARQPFVKDFWHQWTIFFVIAPTLEMGARRGSQSLSISIFYFVTNIMPVDKSCYKTLICWSNLRKDWIVITKFLLDKKKKKISHPFLCHKWYRDIVNFLQLRAALYSNISFSAMWDQLTNLKCTVMIYNLDSSNCQSWYPWCLLLKAW